MKLINNSIVLILFTVFGTTAQAQQTQKLLQQAESATFASKELVYKKASGTDLMLKLYYPTDAAKQHPAIIFFFGGGWKGGTAAQFEKQARYFALRGLVTVLADYRVSSRQHTTPYESVKDARSAMRYLRAHAAELGIKPDAIIAAGGSAGGHLAAAADLTTIDEAGDDTSVSARPNALVLFNPAFDNGPGGAGYALMGANYLQISPLHNIRKGAAPAIVFLGKEDKLIPTKTAQLYKSKMEAVSSRCDLLLYDGQEHGFFNYKPKGDNKYFFITLGEADKFLTDLKYLEAVK